MAEQMKLMLQYDNQINVVAELTRSKEPLISKVQLDKATARINDCFDFDFTGENKFYPFEFQSTPSLQTFLLLSPLTPRHIHRIHLL